jgi:NADH dehydrogenase
MILVVGGTGHLGRALVPRLLERGHRVRVMSRHAATADDLAAAGAVLHPGDIRDPAAVDAAVEGVTVCVSAVQGFAGDGRQSPETVDRDGNRTLVDAAGRAGADVVLMSAVGAGADHPVSLHRMKWAAEEHLRRSGVPWTVVRGTVFAETWADILRQSRNRAGRVQVFGKGENPINFVSVEDVAEAVVHAVEDRDLRSRVIEVGGPDSLTFNAFARLVDPDHEPRHVPRALLRVMATAARPVNPQLARLAGAAVDMDTADMTFDTTPSRTAHPWLTSRPVTALALQK